MRRHLLQLAVKHRDCLNPADALPTAAGANCPGGAYGMQTPLLSLENYWRSGNTSHQVYHCPYLNACHGYPTFSGADAGDDACREGYYGPVCQICLNGWYGYSQGCKCVALPAADSVPHSCTVSRLC